MDYTREQIRENRMKWINFLMTKGRKKTKGTLDKGDGKRCCLGHACFILGITKRISTTSNKIYYGGEEAFAPSDLVDKVGLWTNDGSTDDMVPFTIIPRRKPTLKLEFDNLAGANDSEEYEISPYDIGTYLLTVIDGGPHTPFRPLTSFPEIIDRS